MRAAAEELRRAGCIPFAGFVTDPCDGRTQGTTGMMDSLPYRNDAAIVLGRLIRSLPTRQAGDRRGDVRQGTAGDDDGACRLQDLPAVVVPGGVTLPPTDGEDAGTVADDRGALRARPDDARGGGGSGLPRVRVAGRRMPVPRHRGHVAGRRRSARD